MKHPELNSLLRNVNESEKERLLAKADKLSPKGANKLNDKLDEYHLLLQKTMSVDEKVKTIDSFINDFLKIYPIGCDESKNLYVESVRKRVAQVDKKTGQLIAIHEGIRAAGKATGVYHGTISYICNHTTKGGKGGYKSAGGCFWYFEEEWNQMQMQKNKE